MTEFLLAGVCAVVQAAVVTSTADAVLAELRERDCEADAYWREISDQDDYNGRQQCLAARIEKAFGPLPERTPLNAKTTGIIRMDGYRVEKLMFESRPHYHVTGHLFLPDNPNFKPPYQAVVVVCGHTANGKMSDMYQYGSVECAKAGFAAFIIDPVDQGERGQRVRKIDNPCHEHNRLGPRAALLGEEFALWRAWDAMRAIDCLYERDDIRKDGVGVMGQSGGGTMTCWMRVLDDRVKASAASCFVSTHRHVCAAIGPQDAEQQIYGELEIGLNHAGMQLVRDVPGLVCCKHGDFFPFEGSQETVSILRDVGKRIGRPDNWAMCDADGGHGWAPSTIAGSVLWMRGHLRGEKGVLPLDLPALRARDANAITDKGLAGRPDANVAPNGSVLDLPGERTAYDLLKEKLAGYEAKRVAMDADEMSSCVRRLAGIVLPTNVDRPKVPFDLYRPEGQATDAVLIVADRGRHDIETTEQAEAYRRDGSMVLVADVAGFGELGRMRHVFYASKRPEEGAAVMLYALGKSLVGRRATDILSCAAYLKDAASQRVRLVAARTAVLPAVHAYAAERSLFSGIVLNERPQSWGEQLRTCEPMDYADCVYGALKSYDWPDLLATDVQQ